MKKTLAVLAICICYGASAFAQSAEETARRFITLAYDGRFEELPKSPQANTDAFERKIRHALRVRRIRVDQLEQKPSGDWQVTLVKTARDTAEEWTESFPLRLKLVQNDGRWLVSAVEFPNDELAQQLVTASDEERARLLREHSDRISSSLARAVYNRALGFLNGGKFADAARAGTLAREIAIAAGDRGGEALALGVAMFYAADAANDLAEAQRLSGESLSIAESVGDPDLMARVWYNRGRVFRRDAEMEAQAVAYRNALKWAERAEDPIVQLRVLYSMANVAANNGDQLNARRYLDQMIPRAREVGDIPGEMSGEMVLSTIYIEQGDDERASFHHLRALELAEKHRLNAYPTLLLRSAVTLVGERRFDEALAAFAKVLVRDERGTLTTKLAVPGAHIAVALRSLAEIAAEKGRLDEAECLLREVASVAPSMTESAYFYTLTPYHLRQQRYTAALSVALASLTELPVLFRTQRIEALEAAAHAYHKLGQHDQALVTILEALEMLEEDSTAGDEQQRARVSERRAESYKLAAEIALGRGDAAEALAFLERGRAVVITDILENGRPRATSEADAASEKELRRREGELARLSVDLDRLRTAGREADASAASERLRQARAEYGSFADGIRARSQRRLATRKYADAERLVDVIKRLPARTVAVEYLVTDQHLHLFVAKSSEPMRHLTIAVERTALEKNVTRFAEAVSQRHVGLRTAARELYDVVIAPIAAHLAGAEALVVVPDDLLWQVPFAALIDDRGRFLVERSAIVYGPSITAFTLMSESKEDASPARQALFAVGNPTLDVAAGRAFRAYYRDTTLDPLPDAEREVDTVRSLYGRSTVLKRADATEARTKSLIGDAAIVHFATHGIFDNAHPMYSRLALARDGNAPEDGWLEAWEIMRLDINADLVILSACETARGRVGGEGVVGMAWSFFIAGARSTLATQWKVDSRVSADLMIGFHRMLRKHGTAATLGKARSLREAQLRLMRNKRYEHPFYWAGFVILGDA